MKNFVLGSVIVIASSTLIGCGNSTRSSLQESVSANKELGTLQDWETSGVNPSALFSNWRDQVETSSAELCIELLALPDQELTVFETEISEVVNSELLAGCKADLEDKIENYYLAQRKTTETINVKSFKFPENVQTRDVSKGYRAVFADLKPKEVVLTFDDGPHPEYTDRVLKALNDVNAKSIFFALGKAVKANPEILKKAARAGHAIGSHTFQHPCLGDSGGCVRSNGGKKYSLQDSIVEIKKGHQMVFDTLGFVDPFFRFPYGASTAEVRAFLASNGVGDFFWAIDSNDWRSQTNENLIRTTIEQIERQGRGIVLFHDIQRRTAEIMPQFLRELYNRGYSVVDLRPSDPKARYNSKLLKGGKQNLP